MALVLAFDTSTKHCAVALARDGLLLASRTADDERFSHAEKLNVFIDQVLREAGVELKDMDAVAVGTGPGSYTGLRIGLSAAKGLCFALDVPLIALPSLEVLGAELLASGTDLIASDALHPMIDARRMEVFTSVLNVQGRSESPARPVILDELWCGRLDKDRRHIAFGDGADKATSLWATHPVIVHVPGVRPSVKGLAASAHAAFLRKEFADLTRLVPDYGKEANVTGPGAR